MSSAALPQLERPFLTDAGIETDILYNRGIDLPHFASFILLKTEDGRRALNEYFRGFLDLAKRMDSGIILESATWRASGDWADPLGLPQAELDALNRDAVRMLIGLRKTYQSVVPQIIVSGCIGPRGDGYDPGKIMDVEQAAAYHSHQATVLASAGADMLTGMTITNVPEAVGLAQAAKALQKPVAIAFTVETDGRLPTGDRLADAVAAVDDASSAYPAYYMINCAHPTHFASSLDENGEWTSRIRGIRANASRCSHAQLDVMTELDAGDIAELAGLYRELRQRFPRINVLGGCCGTDLRHITAIAEACLRH